MDDKQMITLEIQNPIEIPPLLLNLIPENPNNGLVIREEEDSLELKNPSENKTVISDYRNLKVITSEKLACCECGKVFPSMKALCGHMRSHPERQYRGIKPNYSVYKNKKHPSCSVSKNNLVSDSNLGFKNQQHIIPSTPRVSKPDWLNCMPKSMSNSPVKTKCKRIASRSMSPMSLDTRTSNECFDEVEEAACTLLMIANGNNIHIEKRTNFKRNRIAMDGGHGVALLEDNVQVLRTSEVPSKGKMTVNRLKKRSVEKDNEKSRDGFDPDLTGSKLETSNGFEKLCELNMVTSCKPAASVLSSDRFDCTTCGRSFTSYQALGGHKSSCKAGNYKADVVGIFPVKEFVINSIHKCKICDKEFPTGQALGGHQTRHRIIGPELEPAAPFLLPEQISEEYPPPLLEVEEVRIIVDHNVEMIHLNGPPRHQIGPELECAPVSSPKVINKKSPPLLLEVEEIKRKVVLIDLNEPPLVDE